MNFKDEILKYKPINEQEANDKKITLDYINDCYNDILTRENQIAHMTSSGLMIKDL